MLSASFSRDGRRIVTAGADGTARVWFTRLDGLVAYAKRPVTRELTPAEREAFLPPS